MHTFTNLLIILVSFWGASAVYAVSVTDSSQAEGWVPVLYSGNSDPTGDQQTGLAGNEADIVGDSQSAALYKGYDGSRFGFRLRLGAQDNKNQGYQSAAIIGMDVNGDNILDYYIGAEVNGVGTGNQKLDIGIYQFIGGGATSPNSTQAALSNAANFLYGYEQTEDNFSWFQVSEIDEGLSPYTVVDATVEGGYRTVDPYNVDGQLDNKGNPQSDYFLSFVVPFADLKAAIDSHTEFGTQVTDFGPDTSLGFVAVTSQNLNQVNNDFNGISNIQLGVAFGGDESSQDSGISKLYTADSLAPIPEPTAYALVFGLMTLVSVWLRRK